MRYRRSDVGMLSDRLAHRLDTIQSCSNRSVTISMHVRVHSCATNESQKLGERFRRKVYRRSTRLTRNPFRMVDSTSVFVVGLKQAPCERWADNTVEKHLYLTHGDGGTCLKLALV